MHHMYACMDMHHLVCGVRERERAKQRRKQIQLATPSISGDGVGSSRPYIVEMKHSFTASSAAAVELHAGHFVLILPSQ